MNKPLLCALLTLCACGPQPVTPEPPPAPLPRRPEPPPDAGPAPGSTELLFPAQVASQVASPVYAQLEGSTAVFSNTLDLALGDAYPSRIGITSKGLAYVAAAHCSYEKPTRATWMTLTAVAGDAATLSLTDGVLSVELNREGTVTAQLEGELADANCSIAGVEHQTLPLRHTLTLRVQRVAGFLVQHGYFPRAGCDGATLVMPQGADVPAPRLRALNAAGQTFEAANAPMPAAMTLRSDAPVVVTNQQWRLKSPGQVAVAVATALPVTGVKTFEVVGPESLTSVDGSLVLEVAAAKGSIVYSIEDGKSYPIWFPEEHNAAFLRVSSATARAGLLCAAVPASWFAVTSSTPVQCAPVPQSSGSSIVGAGECRFRVTIPGTSLQWSAAFSTTRP